MACCRGGVPWEKVLRLLAVKGRLAQVERAFLEKPWREVHAGLAVKLLEERGAALVLVLVLAKSAARRCANAWPCTRRA